VERVRCAALKFFDQSQHRRYSDRIGAGLGKVLEKPERKKMPVEEPEAEAEAWNRRTGPGTNRSRRTVKEFSAINPATG
jgi:hypothetical protein